MSCVKLVVFLLTIGGIICGAVAFYAARKATRIEVPRDPIVQGLNVGTRPDDQAGDAAVIALQAADEARALVTEARATAELNREAAWWTIASVILTALAGMISVIFL